jgi:hypothetical protein
LRGINSDGLLMLDQNSSDQRNDYDLTPDNVKYHQPCGWKHYAIKVVNEYQDESWISSNNNLNE